ncbi:MAG: NAD-dependent epimerase/dehydratase family protein [Crocinitomicaceae bacterium]
MNKVLLIGGAGYVGNVIAEYLLNHNYQVLVYDNFIYDHNFANEHLIDKSNYKFINGDIRNLSTLNDLILDIDSVVILAGLVGDPITKKYPELSHGINLNGIQYCIDYFDDKPIKNLIFVSTCSNYGLIKENELADELFQLNPLSLYAEAKVEAEKYLLNKKDKVNYAATVLRFATAFGLSSRMRFDLSISEFVKELYLGKELLVFDENTWRPYCHVKDFARLIKLVIEANKEKVNFEVFNAGGDKNNYTKKMLIDQILEYIPNGKVRYTKNSPDPRNYRVSFEKVKETLGFEPNFSVRDGIYELVEAFKDGQFSDVESNSLFYGNYFIANQQPTN